ncbi:hypothetical protein [Clostridium sulfidigenes]|uniref:hypothetical protein n=1 Tax=Clostridium sulfidigenes TaxID=318464 RepID=UPI003F8A8F86
MSNILEQKIKEKKELYNNLKIELEKVIGIAQNDYNSLLNQYGKGLGYIRHNSNLSKEGKRVEAKKLHDEYLEKVQMAAVKHLTNLNKDIDSWTEKYNEPSQDPKYLIGKKLPQLIYVTSMLNSIDSPELLNEMFEYVSEDENFSDELVNLVYAKAKSMINAYDKPRNETVDNPWESKDESTNEHTVNAQMNVIGRMKYNKIIQGILDEINQYKTDYSKDAAEMKQRFEGRIKNKEYPINLYVTADTQRDFGIPNDLKATWGETEVSNKLMDPWSR